MSMVLLDGEECEVYVADCEFDIAESQKKLDMFISSKGTEFCLDELAYVMLLIKAEEMNRPTTLREEFVIGRELYNCMCLAVFIHAEWEDYNTMDYDELNIAKDKLCSMMK